MNSRAREANGLARRLRRMRYWRIPLAIALVAVGANAARISSAHLNGSRSRPIKEAPQAVAIESASVEQADTSVNDAERLPETCPPEQTCSQPEAATALPSEAGASGAQPPGDSEIFPAVKRAMAKYRFPIRAELTHLGEAARQVAACWWTAARQTAEDRWKSAAAASESRATVRVEDEHTSDEVTSEVAGGEDAGGEDASADAPDRDAEETVEPAKVVLENTADTGGTVQYLVNGRAHSLKPGDTHTLGPPGHWVVRFHRGGDFGNAEHTIAAGTFTFRVTENGWDLQRALSPDLP